ncbi:MAG: acetyl esterase/lipase [Polaribacter sp.]|jgi:acetyl esterase/lipase
MKDLKIIYLIGMLFFMGCSNSGNKNSTTEPAKVSSFWGMKHDVETEISYGDNPEQKLDVYSQGQSIGEPNFWLPDTINHPTLIYFHGGGWIGGSKEDATLELIPYLERGWNIVNIEYRKGKNTAPKAVDDAMCAISWVAENATRFNIDLENIVISGNSAGGHLALITGLLNTIPDSHNCYVGNQLKIKAIVNWYGITDIAKVENYLRTKKPEWNYAGFWIEGLERVDSISASYSPVKKITSETPPIITIHGELDAVVPFDQAVTFHDLLNEVGIKNELVSDPKGKHAGFSEKQFKHIYSRIFNFLDDVIE